MKSILKLPLFLWIVFTLLVYSSVLVSPLIFKYSGIISFGVPIVILLNVAFLFASIFFKWKSGFVALVLLVIAYPFLNVGISFKGDQDSTGETFKVLNYNIMRFNYPKQASEREEMATWILEQKADIICLQEFSFRDKYANELKNADSYNSHFGGYANSFAIFSRYPIVRSGQLFEDSQTNNATYVDVLINSDTLRVYNVHLQSMGINPDEIQSTEGIKEEYEKVAGKFLVANAERTRQIEEMMSSSEGINYPILMVGDFNDVPFSYNYFKIRGSFVNSFEEAGYGFGTSYNGKLPYLRIDNQFHSKGLRAVSFETHNDVYYSDHFPLVGIYEITP